MEVSIDHKDQLEKIDLNSSTNTRIPCYFSRYKTVIKWYPSLKNYLKCKICVKIALKKYQKTKEFQDANDFYETFYKTINKDDHDTDYHITNCDKTFHVYKGSPKMCIYCKKKVDASKHGRWRPPRNKWFNQYITAVDCKDKNCKDCSDGYICNTCKEKKPCRQHYSSGYGVHCLTCSGSSYPWYNRIRRGDIVYKTPIFVKCIEGCRINGEYGAYCTRCKDYYYCIYRNKIVRRK